MRSIKDRTLSERAPVNLESIGSVFHIRKKIGIRTPYDHWRKRETGADEGGINVAIFQRKREGI